MLKRILIGLMLLAAPASSVVFVVSVGAPTPSLELACTESVQSRVVIEHNASAFVIVTRSRSGTAGWSLLTDGCVRSAATTCTVAGSVAPA